MSEDFRPENNTAETGTEEQSWVPASIYKRVWAWVGVVYMVIVTVLVTYFIATWTFLTGLTGIMLFPALAGFCIVKAIQSHEMEYKVDKIGPAIWSVLSGVLAVVCLIWGITQVLANLG